MKVDLVTSVLILAILSFVLYKSDYLGGPDSLPDTIAFFSVAAVLGARLWIAHRPPKP